MSKYAVRKAISIFVLLSFIIVTFGNSISPAYGDSGLRGDLQVINLEPNDTINHETDYWPDRTINAAGDVSISGAGSKLVNPWIVITVPKSNKISKPGYVDSQNAIYNRLVEEDPDNYYLVYKFKEISGGFRATFRAPFKFLDNQNTHNGDTIKVKVDVRQGDDSNDFKDKPILYSAEKTYKLLKQEFEYNETLLAARDGQWDEPNARKVYSMNVTPNQTNTGDPGYVVSLYGSHLYDLPKDFNGNPSYVIPSNIKIIYTLPEGVEPNGNLGSYKWDESTRTLTNLVENPSRQGPDWPRSWKNGYTHWLSVRMVNKPFDETQTVTARYIVDAGLPTERELTPREVKFAVRANYFSPGGGFEAWKDNLNGGGSYPINYDISEGNYSITGDTISDRRYDQTENGLYYRVYMRANNNGSAFDNPENGKVTALYKIEDIRSSLDNDKRTSYKSFQFKGINGHGNINSFSEERRTQIQQELVDSINNTPNVLYGVKDDGTKVELAKNVQLEQKIDINDPKAEYAKLLLEFSKPIVLNNMVLTYNIGLAPTADEIQKFKDHVYTDRQEYRGKANFLIRTSETVTDDESQAKWHNTNDTYAYTSLEPISPKAVINGASSNELRVTYSKQGATFTYWSQAQLSTDYGLWGAMGSQPIKNAKLIQLIPEGFNYVRKHSQYWYGKNIEEPEVIKNYKNTGKTAVIYTIPEMIPNNSNLRAIGIRTTLEATPYAKRGANNPIETYFMYDKNDIITEYQSWMKTNDSLDIDNDGDREERVLVHRANVNYVPPLELIVKKEVGYDTSAFGLSTTGDLGYNFFYRVNIFNNTIGEVNSVHVIDVLPYKGDHAIVPNDSGQYLQRNSKFATPLSASIESVPENATVLQRFNILYKLAPQGDDLASVTDGGWVPADQVSDFSQVKSFKLELKSGSTIASKEEVNLIVPSKIPYDTSLTPGECAINSAAVSTDGTIFSEGNQVCATYTKYKVDGVFFKDLNKDGIKGDTEDPVAGRKVELIDAETGNVALDFNNQPIPSVTTDAEGKYHFEVYKRGSYKIRFTKADDEEYSAESNRKFNGNNVTDTADNEGTTYDFTLNPAADSAILNAGIIADKRNVKVLKVSSELDEQGNNIPLSGVPFELKSNTDESIKFEGTTDSSGNIVFPNVLFGEYTLTEKSVPEGYQANSLTRVVNVNGDPLEVIKVVNDAIIRDVKLKKVDADDNNLPLEGVKFGLFKGDASTAEYEATTGTDGVATFSNVKYGEYKLKEISTIKGYALNTSINKTVSVRENGDALDLGTITNSKIKGSIVVTKSDSDDENVKLEGVVFALKKGENEVATATTNDQGVATFNNVVYGEYTLAEKTPLEGYLPSTRTETVNIDSDGKSVAFADWKNTKIKGNISLSKVDADSNEPLAGVVFALKQGDKEITTATTGQDGSAVFSNVAYGDYTVVEKTALVSHVLDTTTVHPVSIRENGTTVALTQAPITNVMKKAPVVLTKTDVDSGEPLAGVKFELRKGNEVVASKVTDVEGKVTFADVAYGDYTLVETETVASHVLDPTPIAVQVRENGVTVNKSATNVMKKAPVVLTKTDVDSGKPLQGVTYELRQNGEVLASKVTDAEGKVTFASVPYGDYTLVEVQAPESYVLDPTPIAVQVRENGVTVNKSATNVMKKAPVVLTKTDVDTHEPLQGVTYELRKGNEVVGTRVTDVEGKVTFASVPYGDYTLVETATLVSHVLDSTPIAVQVRENGVTVNKSATNVMKKAPVVLTKTDADTHEPLQGVTYELRKGNDVVASKVTDVEGKVTFASVPYGDYTLVETATLVSHVLDSTPVSVQVRENGVQVDKEATNVAKKSTIVVTKKDKELGAELAGITFELRDKDGNRVDSDKTNEQGKVTFSNIRYGDYTVVETETIDSHVLDSTPVSVQVREDGAVIEKEITNVVKKSTIVLTKTDKDSGQPLAGVKYELRRPHNQSVPSLFYGDLVRIVDPSASLPNEDSSASAPVSAVSDSDSPSTEANTTDSDNTDSSTTGSNSDENSSTQPVDYDVIATAVTDSEGKVSFADVPYGDYELVETQTLEEYVLDSTPISVEVREDGQTIQKSATNVMKKSKIVLTKTDKGSGEPLAGVTFELRAKANGRVVGTSVTDAQGKVTFADVPYGDYELVETKAKAGYVLDSTPISVEVREDGQTIQKSMSNVKKPVVLRKLPATGVDEGLFTGLVTLLFAGCVFGLVSRKGRNSSQK
ncbi:hypothetical protein HCQ94_00770 [Actinomyces sp. zg-332]|uniref:SpaA isopeptide-forming pilin-related protein n=1 Tax=Actinomyces sp. zg-332 TaxID=2708340 RepID=UPI001422EF9A|nr:SpaA isopeptide-forming pilin-related protein [Actinomyces sp. zg-332]QPK94282.1 hypothetical protein HCQ94_00770 [Actinomyces sp. zg-332]